MSKKNKKSLKRVLIANRGEIAVRIIRACRELGIESVAVYSDADKDALHVKEADHAFNIGPAPAAESYLKADRVIELALESNCDAIHPGYGFLSESAEFSENVAQSGLIFIGPTASSMRLMGDKISARNTANAHNVPTTPGVFDPIDDLNEAKSVANEIGFPVLVKAAAGGGGKGMRLINDEADMEESFERAISEVEKSFGDRAVFIEKYIANAKHIEFQVMADSHGNTVHLYERECSVQRRYQKVIEETPAPTLPDEIRQEMAASAVAVTRACDYVCAGTIEFIYDVDDARYYFLEMNTRIQVEHPITEMTTGIDLVREQLLVAAGNKLSFSQKDVQPTGAAIECRIYAEDPDHNFAPSTGVIEHLRLPTGSGIRVDSGVVQGDEVSRHYDPMLMKLVVWDEDRSRAIAKMINALEEMLVVGVATPIGFHLDVLRGDSFQLGEYTTDFINTFTRPDLPETEAQQLALVAALAHHLNEQNVNCSIQDSQQESEGLWRWNR